MCYSAYKKSFYVSDININIEKILNNFTLIKTRGGSVT